jgi:Tol biopolymer transport system component
LQGKEADARSDLFSFGCVLYEMLTGKRAFEGESAASVIAAILEREPAPIEVAPPLERVIRTCLAKDPDQRFQNALDLKRDLAWAAEQPVAASPKRRSWIPAAVAMIVLAAGAGGWTLSLLRQRPADDPVIRFEISPPEGSVVGGGIYGGGFAISPDGQTAAFIGVVKGKSGLWVRPLNATTARLLPGTEGAVEPFWSPDNRSIAFFAGGLLQRIDLSGQPASKICDVAGAFYGGSWSSDGRILFAIRDVGVFQVPASGGSASQLTTLDRTHGEVNHESPQVIPGGRFLYTVQSLDGQTIFAASLTKPADKIGVLSVGRGESNTPGTGAWYGSGSDGNDYLFWIRGWRLFAQQFEARKVQLIGEPRSLADHVGMARAASRVLLYSSFAPLRQFKWFDRKGTEIGVLGEPKPYVFARISPDGRRVATIHAGSNPDIWLLEVGRGVASRLTAGRGFHISPVWSPDGRTFLFSSGTPFNIFRISSDGAGGEERVTESPNRQTVTDWSHDGRFILYQEAAPQTGYDLWSLAVTREGLLGPGAQPRPYIRAPFDQMQARFSPDDRWIAYQSDESGTPEIYMQTFPEPHEKIRISTGGGRLPQWGAGGRELFYSSRDGKLMSVALKLGANSAEAALPRELFAMPAGIAGSGSYEATPDGQRFLINDMLESTEPLNVIVNWTALLKQGSAAQ